MLQRCKLLATIAPLKLTFDHNIGSRRTGFAITLNMRDAMPTSREFVIPGFGLKENFKVFLEGIYVLPTSNN